MLDLCRSALPQHDLPHQGVALSATSGRSEIRWQGNPGLPKVVQRHGSTKTATESPKLHDPSPHVPSSAVTCTQTCPPPMPGIWLGNRENSGYLLMGKARGALLFHVGRRDSVLGGGLWDIYVDGANFFNSHEKPPNNILTRW